MKAQCPECSKPFTVSEEMRGRKVKCKCGNVMQLPATAPVATPVATPAAKNEQKILVPCSSCSKVLRVSVDAIGKIAKCACGAQTRIQNPQAAPTTPFADPLSTGPSAQPIADPYATPMGNPMGNPMGIPMGIPYDPYAPAGNDPWKGQGIQSNEPDPLGIGNLNYGTELARPPAPIRPRPKPVHTSQSSAKKNKIDGTTLVIGIVQVVIGILSILGAVALLVVSFEAENVKGRSYRGMIFLAIFGACLIGNGCRTFMGIEDD